MKKEWWVDLNSERWPDDIGGIVVGDEGCIYRALNPDWLTWTEKAKKHELTVRYITPPVPNKFVEELFNFIQKLGEITTLKVTFNDYGMIYRCMELTKNTQIVPVLGRIITRSILDCPWHEELLKHENPELAVAVIGGNFVHQSKWEVLNKFNIHEIELNIDNMKDKEQLLQSGLALTWHMSNQLISVGRLCYSARWQGLKLPDCSGDSRCRRKLELMLDQKWGKLKLIYENPADQIKEKYQDLFVLGNVVLKENKIEANLNLGIESVIYT